MRVHPGRATLMVVALAELGAVAGALLAALFFGAWALLGYGALPLQGWLGILVWAGITGAPLGALALPLLGLTVLRRIPLGRALGFSAAGALLGVVAAAIFVAGSAGLPVPALVPAFGFAGLFAGVAAARVDRLRLRPRQARRIAT